MQLPVVPVTSHAGATLNFQTIARRLTIPRLQVHSALTLPNEAPGVLLKLKVAVVDVDNKNWWDEVNNRYVPKIKGTYLVGVAFQSTVNLEDGKFVDVAVWKNGAVLTPVGLGYARFVSAINATYGAIANSSVQVECNGSTDTLEVAGNSTQAGHTGTATLWSVRVA